jgi:hypothetical protein
MSSINLGENKISFVDQEGMVAFITFTNDAIERLTKVINSEEYSKYSEDHQKSLRAMLEYLMKEETLEKEKILRRRRAFMPDYDKKLEEWLS